MDALRAQLVAMLDGRDARMPFEAAVAGFPGLAINARAPNVEATPWSILEHIRIAQRDILDSIRDRAYLAPDWPDEYWPPSTQAATADEFLRSVEAIQDDLAALRDLVADPATDLLATIPGTPGHSILREIRVIAEHNAYLVGEFAILRRVMGTWPPDRGG